MAGCIVKLPKSPYRRVHGMHSQSACPKASVGRNLEQCAHFLIRPLFNCAGTVCTIYDELEAFRQFLETVEGESGYG